MAGATLFACNDNKVDNSTAGLKLHKYSNDDYYTVISYASYDGDEDGTVVLDLGAIATERGVTIGRIQTGAFAGNSTIKEIVVPDTVVEIDGGAFKGIENLAKITLPFVGAGAKADAYMGETAKSEDKITDAKRNFGYIFGEDSYDTTVSVTQTYGAENTTTFYLPHNLTEVVINPKDNYSIPMYAFYGVTTLRKITFSDKVVAVGVNAFYGCENLSTVEMKKVTTLYDGAFQGCTNLKEYNSTSGRGINFNNVSLTKIGEKAFYGTAFKELNLTVAEVGDSAFSGTGLTSVTLTGVKKIGDYAFYDCTSLTIINITVDSNAENKSVGVYAFCNCKKVVVTESTVSGFDSYGANWNYNTKA